MKHIICCITILVLILMSSSVTYSNLPKFSIDLETPSESLLNPRSTLKVINFDVCYLKDFVPPLTPPYGLILVADMEGEPANTPNFVLNTNTDTCGIQRKDILQPILVFLIWQETETVEYYIWNWNNGKKHQGLEQLSISELEAVIPVLQRSKDLSRYGAAGLTFVELSRRLREENPVKNKDIGYLVKEDFPDGVPENFPKILKMILDILEIVIEEPDNDWAKKWLPIYKNLYSFW